jgi:hypothetical protein
MCSMTLLRKIFLILASVLIIILVAAWATCPAPDARLSSVAGSTVISMPVKQAWNKLRDLTLAHHYVPGIVDTEIITDRKTGIGASRRVYRDNNTYLIETVISWDEGHGFKIRLHDDQGDAPFPFASAWFTYRLSPEGTDRTRLDTSLEYEMRGGCLGHWIDHLALSDILRQRANDVPDNLRRFYESGDSNIKEAAQD